MNEVLLLFLVLLGYRPRDGLVLGEAVRLKLLERGGVCDCLSYLGELGVWLGRAGERERANGLCVLVCSCCSSNLTCLAVLFVCVTYTLCCVLSLSESLSM